MTFAQTRNPQKHQGTKKPQNERALPSFLFPLRSRLFRVSLCLCVLMSLNSCAKPQPKPSPTLKEANDTFLRICREDFNLTPKLTAFENTVYIYLPVDHEVVGIKSNGFPKTSRESRDKRSLLFLDTAFFDAKSSVSFDIRNQTSYAKDPGYGFSYAEQYKRRQQQLLSALSRAYNELDQDKAPGDINFQDAKKQYTHDEVVRFKPVKNSPDFVVLIITDIRKGMEIITTFYYPDYKYAAVGQLPMDEYAKRIMTDVAGNEDAVGDFQGKHIEYKEMTWPDFLAKQIKHRINFKYTQSMFPPSDDDEKEILKIVNETLRAYNFTDFEEIRLENLAANAETVFNKDDLDGLPAPDVFTKPPLRARSARVARPVQDDPSDSGSQPSSPSASEPSRSRIYQIQFDETGNIKSIDEESPGN